MLVRMRVRSRLLNKLIGRGVSGLLAGWLPRRESLQIDQISEIALKRLFEYQMQVAAERKTAAWLRTQDIAPGESRLTSRLRQAFRETASLVDPRQSGHLASAPFDPRMPLLPDYE